jgi:protein-S-isoprenylcysteine O-methyltransferase Ste14
MAKNLYWLTTLIPGIIPNTADVRFQWSGYIMFCLLSLWGIVGWGTIYFLRSITEERLLSKDPDYVAYCKKVKYRFIPGVY